MQFDWTSTKYLQPHWFVHLYPRMVQVITIWNTSAISLKLYPAARMTERVERKSDRISIKYFHPHWSIHLFKHLRKCCETTQMCLSKH